MLRFRRILSKARINDFWPNLLACASCQSSRFQRQSWGGDWGGLWGRLPAPLSAGRNPQARFESRISGSVRIGACGLSIRVPEVTWRTTPSGPPPPPRPALHRVVPPDPEEHGEPGLHTPGRFPLEPVFGPVSKLPVDPLVDPGSEGGGEVGGATRASPLLYNNSGRIQHKDTSRGNQGTRNPISQPPRRQERHEFNTKTQREWGILGFGTG